MAKMTDDFREGMLAAARIVEAREQRIRDEAERLTGDPDERDEVTSLRATAWQVGLASLDIREALARDANGESFTGLDDAR